MRITNLSNLPLPLVRAVANDPYSSGDCDFTTTSLIKPPRIVALERQHADELTEDAADRIWSLIGQIGHLILERANKEGEIIVERRFFATICGVKIGGQIDLLSEIKTLVDYKLLSTWATKDGVKAEHEQQINVNAWLCRQNGIEVSGGQIVALYRDWLVGEARRNKNYPQQQVQVFPVKLWTPERQEDFVCERIQLHLMARKELPECSDLERWARGEKWAVMSHDSTSGKAIRLYDTPQQAQAHADEKPSKYYVEHRPPVQTRCLDYCSVAQHCEWWQNYQKEHKS